MFLRIRCVDFVLSQGAVRLQPVAGRGGAAGVAGGGVPGGQDPQPALSLPFAEVFTYVYSLPEFMNF